MHDVLPSIASLSDVAKVLGPRLTANGFRVAFTSGGDVQAGRAWQSLQCFAIGKHGKELKYPVLMLEYVPLKAANGIGNSQAPTLRKQPFSVRLRQGRSAGTFSELGKAVQCFAVHGDCAGGFYISESAAAFSPMQAPVQSATVDDLAFPLLASPKYDGIRCLMIHGQAMTKSLRPIPNAHVRSMLTVLGHGLDGELITFTDGKRDDFNTVQSKIMKATGEPDFCLMVFDSFAQPDQPFKSRAWNHMAVVAGHIVAQRVKHVEIATPAELEAYESQCVDGHGEEGIMARHPDAPYRYGRVTVADGIIYKIKRFADDEARILGCNEATESRYSGQRKTTVGLGHLASFRCLWKGVEFDLGTGLSDAQRETFWAERESLIAKNLTFKFTGTGSGGAPRSASFLHFRDDE